jgi:hypothetical protein
MFQIIYSQFLVPGDTLYIGSVSDFADIVARPGQLTASNFIGCMRNIIINGLSLPQMDIRAKVCVVMHLHL